MLGAAGLLGLEYDPAYGGQGADHSFTVVFGEEIGRIACGGVPMAISVQTDMATPSLHRYGSEELKQQYLVPAVAGTSGRRHRGHRARRRLRRGRPAHPGPPRRRRVGDRRHEALHHQRGPGRLDLCRWPAPPTRAARSGMSQIDRAHRHPGLLGQPHARQAGHALVGHRRAGLRRRAGAGRATSSATRGAGFQQQMEQFQQERMIACYQAVGSMEQALARHPRRTWATARRSAVRCTPTTTCRTRWPSWSAEVDLLKHYNYACAEAFVAGRRHQADGRHRQADDRPAAAPGGRRVPAVPRRHGLHGGALDGARTSATSASGPSAGAPTRSCCAPSPSSTAPEQSKRSRTA